MPTRWLVIGFVLNAPQRNRKSEKKQTSQTTVTAKQENFGGRDGKQGFVQYAVGNFPPVMESDVLSVQKNGGVIRFVTTSVTVGKATSTFPVEQTGFAINVTSFPLFRGKNYASLVMSEVPHLLGTCPAKVLKHGERR